MNSVPDRKKLRWEYLDRKADAFARAIEGGLLIATVLLFLAHSPQMAYAGFRVWEDHFFALYGAVGGDDKMLRSFTAVLLTTIVLAGTAVGLLSVLGIRLIKQARRAAHIPYVPPVTFNTLPAEEVLVRGAEEPSTPHETLLRGTVKGEEAKTDELLHIATGAKSDG